MLALLLKAYVDNHLVTVKSRHCRLHRPMDADAKLFTVKIEERWLEGLDLNGGVDCAVQEHWVFLDYFFQDIPGRSSPRSPSVFAAFYYVSRNDLHHKWFRAQIAISRISTLVHL